LDGEHQGGRRIQRIHTERDRTISFVPGQKRVEKLRHWPTRSAVQGTRYKLVPLLTNKDMSLKVRGRLYSVACEVVCCMEVKPGRKKGK